MHRMHKYNYKKIIKQSCAVIFIVTLIYLLSAIDKQALESIALRLGWIGPVFLALVLVSTQVFAPLSGSAFYFIGIRLYGYEAILIMFYCTSMISAVLCFFIARKWGRDLVIKLVGKNAMARIDEIALIHEKSLLIIGRTLGYYFFDFISYALGLTKISFKKYITYTAVLTLIPSLLLYFVFKNLDFNSFKNSMIFYLFVVLTGVIFAFLFARLVRNKRTASKAEN
jgi:uncharacterized membrane protein YdjX (TVP38/TMEM64 family)